MDILKWLLNVALGNWDNLLVIFIFLISIAFLWSKGKQNLVMDMLYKIIAEVELKMGKGAGKLKKIEVLNQVYDWMPAILKIFITRKMLDEWLEDIIVEVKESLESREERKQVQNG